MLQLGITLPLTALWTVIINLGQQVYFSVVISLNFSQIMIWSKAGFVLSVVYSKKIIGDNVGVSQDLT